MGALFNVIGHVVIVAATYAWTFPLTVALEFLFPRGSPGQMARLQGVVIWLVYFALTGAILAGEAALFARIPLRPLFTLTWPWTGWVAGVGGAILAGLAADFFYYWAHRAQHTRLLWPLHAVHHGIRDLNAINSYHHWTEEIVRLPFMALPLAFLIKLEIVQLPIATALIVLHSGYVHSATRLNFGPLVRVLADNRFHRIHHSIEERHFGKNFCVFTTLWDQLFGTAHLPVGDEWPDTGLADQLETGSIRAYLLARSDSEISAPTAAPAE